MSVRVAVRHFVVHLLLVFIAVSCVIAIAANDANARGPVAAGETIPVEWPCLAEGWQAGDAYGPGPADIVPDVPPCPIETPHPSSIYPLGTPAAPQLTLPPTDTP